MSSIPPYVDRIFEGVKEKLHPEWVSVIDGSSDIFWGCVTKTVFKTNSTPYDVLKIICGLNDLEMFRFLVIEDRWLTKSRAPYLNGIKEYNYPLKIRHAKRYSFIETDGPKEATQVLYVIDQETGNILTHTKTPLGKLGGTLLGGVASSVNAISGSHHLSNIRYLAGGSIFFPNGRIRVRYNITNPPKSTVYYPRATDPTQSRDEMVGWTDFQKILIKLVRYRVESFQIELPEWVFSSLSPALKSRYFKRLGIDKGEEAGGIYTIKVEHVLAELGMMGYIDNYYQPIEIAHPLKNADFPITIRIDPELIEWVREQGYDRPERDMTQQESEGRMYFRNY